MQNEEMKSNFKASVVLILGFSLLLWFKSYSFHWNKVGEKRVESLASNSQLFAPKDSDLFANETLIKVDSNNIFFVESNEDLTEFSGRTLCAFEAAAIHNPNSQVYVILSSGSKLKSIQKLFKNEINNVHFVKVNIDSLVVGTPVEDLWKSGQIQSTKYKLNNISNLLRLVLMYNFGGMYLDSDVLFLKTLPVENNSNFIAAEEKNGLNNAIMRFESRHRFLRMAMTKMVIKCNFFFLEKILSFTFFLGRGL